MSYSNQFASGRRSNDGLLTDSDFLQDQGICVSYYLVMDST